MSSRFCISYYNKPPFTCQGIRRFFQLDVTFQSSHPFFEIPLDFLAYFAETTEKQLQNGRKYAIIKMIMAKSRGCMPKI